MARSFWKFFAPLTGCTTRVRRRPTQSFRPSVLMLEDRAMPSVVTTLADDGSPGSLRSVINNAGIGETITFGSLSGTITLSPSMGGEIANSTANLTIMGPGAGTLTISGGDAAHTSSSRIFNFSSSASDTISGLTFINGKAGPFGAEFDGGAIISEGTLTVNNCVFSNNIATDPMQIARGGAIYSNAPLTLNNDTFVNNSADDYGGAVAHVFTPGSGPAVALTANNSYFSNNGALVGGGVAAFSKLSLTGDFFDGNGGPLDSTTHLITRANTGGNVSAWNGGILQFAGDPLTQTIDRTTLAGGKAVNGGGLYYINAVGLSLTNSTIYGNDASGLGGGIDQSAGVGGLAAGSGLTINSTTVTANTGGIAGGGIYNGDGPVVLKNTIVAGNTQGTPFYGSAPGDISGTVLASFTDVGVVTITSDHNIIGDGRGMSAFTNTRAVAGGPVTATLVDLRGLQGNQVGTEASPINAGLSDLRNNGGPAVGAPGGGFNLKTVALLATSPAIGAADPALAGTSDANGTVRSATPNVGAIEYVANTADHVVFLQQPTTTGATLTISPVVVEVVDQFGNFVNTDSIDTVTLAIGNDPSFGAATLSGTLTLTFVNGLATFSDLSIDTAGTGYTLRATGSLPGTVDSDPFDIT